MRSHLLSCVQITFNIRSRYVQTPYTLCANDYNVMCKCVYRYMQMPLTLCANACDVICKPILRYVQTLIALHVNTYYDLYKHLLP